MAGLASIVACESTTPATVDNNKGIESNRKDGETEPAEARPSAEPAGDPTATSTQADGTAAPSTTGTPPPTGGAEEPIPDPITHPCVVTAAKYDVVLAGASGACSTDADCDCFPGGISRKGACGGVTDKKTAAQLHALNAEFAKDKCVKEMNCAPRPCTPKCDKGICK